MAAKRSKRLSRFHGVLVVDKPPGRTSQDVVDAVRRLTQTRRVGHTGTLDPLATGLLIVLLGEATRLSEYLVGFDKDYEGTMRLGVVSDTYDIEGNVQPASDGHIPGLERLQEIAANFVGPLDQKPPAYSAVKIAGRKLYEYARAGESIEAESRPVHVAAFEVPNVDGDRAGFRISCSSGTYVRSLVHDLGQIAGCGAVVETLRRTRVGDFRIEEATPLQTLVEAGIDSLGDFLHPMMDALAEWPLYWIEEGARVWLQRGQAIPAGLLRHDGESPKGLMDGLVYLCDPQGDALAVGRQMPAPLARPPVELRRFNGPWFQPVKLLIPQPE